MGDSKNSNAMGPTNDGDGPIFSLDIVDGLHRCVDSGMSTTQISATLLLISGLFKMHNSFDEHELMGRIHHVLSIIHTQNVSRKGKVIFNMDEIEGDEEFLVEPKWLKEMEGY